MALKRLDCHPAARRLAYPGSTAHNPVITPLVAGSRALPPTWVLRTPKQQDSGQGSYPGGHPGSCRADHPVHRPPGLEPVERTFERIRRPPRGTAGRRSSVGCLAGKASTSHEGETPDWPRPSLAVDALLFTVSNGGLHVLVHRRPSIPRKDELALPGVFLLQNEPPEDAARRALKDKGGFAYDGSFELVSIENHPHRQDPRGWVITTLHLAVIPWQDLQDAAEEAPGVRLVSVTVPWRDSLGEPVLVRTAGGEEVPLAFDHGYLIGKGVAWLRREIWRGDWPLRLVRDPFTLRQLQDVYQAILGEPLFRTTFRRRLVNTLGLIEPTGEALPGDARQPELFRRRHQEL